jgi:hypothetical protein
VVQKTLCHPNVLPLLGVMKAETQFVMLSEWMVNGNINEFTKVNANVDWLELVCFLFRALHLQLTIA